MKTAMTPKTPRALVLAIGLAAAVGLATAAEQNPLATPPKDRPYTPSPVIFPAQQVPLRFFHDKHLNQEIDCATCHANAPESTSSKDVLVPAGFEGEEICTACHDFSGEADETPPGKCTTCHWEGYDPKIPPGADPHDSHAATVKPALMVIPPPNIKMNHKLHVDRGIPCQRCHGEMKDLQVATRENALPIMSTCMECHDGKTAPSACRTCHLTKPDGRIETTLATGVLKPAGHLRNDAHDDRWLKDHATVARNDEAYCQSCHEERYCLKCHNGVVKPFKIHPNNWVLIHPVAARVNDPTCTSCHRLQTFCIQCHQRMNVANRTDYKPPSKPVTEQDKLGWPLPTYGGFHPPGWVDQIAKGTSRGPNHHSFQAQRNIRACAACHTEKTCTTCHATSQLLGVGISPHGGGWKGSAKCEALRRTNERVCVKCHKTVPSCD